jgi:hypothetical protein
MRPSKGEIMLTREQKDAMQSATPHGYFSRAAPMRLTPQQVILRSKTMSKAGPDNHYVHRSICQEGRSCWKSCDAGAQS